MRCVIDEAEAKKHGHCKLIDAEYEPASSIFLALPNRRRVAANRANDCLRKDERRQRIIAVNFLTFSAEVDFMVGNCQFQAFNAAYVGVWI